MLNLIVAIAQNGGIGKDNDLLAHISPDLKYFKKTTKDSVIIMGYNTFLSLPNGPLKNRINVVLTRKEIDIEGCIVLHSIDQLMEELSSICKGKEAFIIGGASIYEQFLPLVDKLYITHVFKDFEADTFFPKIGPEWTISQTFASTENIHHKYPHVFTIYEKK